MDSDWPHQKYAVREVRRAIDAHIRKLALTSPTGGGKTKMVQRIIEWGGKVVVASNRVMLIEQLARGLNEAGIFFGIHASGYAPEVFERVQVASLQSLHKWWKGGHHDLPEADIFILDEAHNETGERACEILQEYHDRGATTICLTATPVGIGHMAEELIVAGCTSELRACGALVPAFTVAPCELDLKMLNTQAKGIVQIKGQYKETALKVVVGSVLEHYKRLNPDHLPTVLFAPGVQESRWFCEQFNAAGIPWSHIDSKSIILNGEEMPANTETRELLREASKSGRTKGISNRFVMREGVDYPWLAHGIFACTFGSVSSYLQAGGRLLRSHPSLDRVTIQDHGGNWWRHDSLNADRVWRLEDTDKILQERHDDVYRNKELPQPIVCPKCSMVRSRGPKCPKCGFAYVGTKRMVVQTNGKLRAVSGDIFKKRVVSTTPEEVKKWVACVYRCMRSNRSFNQALSLYKHENGGHVPGPDFPMQPKFASDWYEKVKAVPRERLNRVK